MPAIHSMALLNHCACAFKVHRLLEGCYLHESQVSVWAGWYLLFTCNCFHSIGGGNCWKYHQQTFNCPPDLKKAECAFGRLSFFSAEIREGEYVQLQQLDRNFMLGMKPGWCWTGVTVDVDCWEVRWKIRSLLCECKDLQREVSQRKMILPFWFRISSLGVTVSGLLSWVRTFVQSFRIERFLKKRRRKRLMCSLK